jgi:hypothetical protein
MNVGFYRKDQLVYASVLKCASTFYTNVVVSNDWIEIQFADINWNNDHVFGFIMNPAERYMKGLAEDIADPETSWSIDNLPIYKDSVVFTFHSLPIYATLNEYLYKIDWIPIDRDFKSETMLECLLKKYNITLNWPNIGKHESSSEKLKIYNKIKNLIDLNNHVLRNSLSPDVELYKNIISKFQPSASIWDQISWLKNK